MGLGEFMNLTMQTNFHLNPLLEQVSCRDSEGTPCRREFQFPTVETVFSAYSKLGLTQLNTLLPIVRRFIGVGHNFQRPMNRATTVGTKGCSRAIYRPS